MRVAVDHLYQGKRHREAYICPGCHKVRRLRESVDEVVEGVVVARLSQPDGPDLLAGDPNALRESIAKREAFEARLATAADQFADGSITGDQLRRITAKLRPQIDVERSRAEAAAPSPELREMAGPDVSERWEGASLDVKRAIIELLMSVTIMPTGSGRSFNPETVAIEWRQP